MCCNSIVESNPAANVKRKPMGNSLARLTIRKKPGEQNFIAFALIRLSRSIAPLSEPFDRLRNP